MKLLTKADAQALIRTFYCEALASLAHIASEPNSFHPEALQKFLAALEDSRKVSPPPMTAEDETLLKWLRARRDQPILATDTFFQLKESAEAELAEIFGQQNAQNLALYLLFFREVTARFLRPEAVHFTLTTNQAAYQKVFGGIGQQVFDHYSIHQTLLAIYSASFADAYNSPDRKVLEALKLKNKNVLDAGGGSGGLALAFETCSIPVGSYDVFDLPETMQALAQPRALFYDKLHAPKRLVFGNFFEENLQNPEFLRDNTKSYDAIFLTWILHDWNDELCKLLLKNLRPLLKENGRLIVVERIKNSSAHPFSAIYEFIMLLLAAGVERTLSEYDELLLGCGFIRDLHLNSPGTRDFMIYKLE